VVENGKMLIPTLTAVQLFMPIACSVIFTVGPFLIYLFADRRRGPFVMDPQGQSGEFVPIMNAYLKLADGLWALGIVTLGYIASPVILHGVVAYEPEHLGSLTLLNTWEPFVVSIFSVLLFRVLLVVWYEAYRHDKASYTRLRYTTVRALPFVIVFNLVIGYVFIAIDVALWVHNGGGNVLPSTPRHYY
jgi:hypothetical protein